MTDVSSHVSAPRLDGLGRRELARRLRVAQAAADDWFITRWSSRAFGSEALPAGALEVLFEAARWAPSAANAQPALFLYADAEPELSVYRALVRDGNRRWADRAPVLAFVFARRQHQGGPNLTAAFDTGAAWMSLALQAHELNLVVRAMGGIHRERVYEALGVPSSEFEVMCGVAIGVPGDPSCLPAELLEREQPNARRALSEVALRGRYSPSSPVVSPALALATANVR
jgi:nitroreductase